MHAALPTIKPGSPLKTGSHAHLDIGDSQTICLIASAGPDGEPRIDGTGVRETRGITSSAVTDLEALVDTITGAVSIAEKTVGQPVSTAAVSFSAGRPESHFIDIDIELAGHPVRADDIAQALKEAERLLGESALADNRRLVLIEPTAFDVDGSLAFRAPIGMFGKVLKVFIHGVTADDDALKNLELAVTRSHLDVGIMIPTSYASGLATLVDDERRLGAAVIDLGAGCRDICLYVQSVPVYAAVLPGGGDQITEDIARTLLTPFDAAERLKIFHGHAVPSSGDHLAGIDVPQLGAEPGDCVQVTRWKLNAVIEARLRQLLTEIRSVLDGEGFFDQHGSSVVLTGGVSMTEGLLPLAQEILGTNVRLGEPRALPGLPVAAQGHQYASAIGLVLFMASWTDSIEQKTKTKPKPPSFGRLFNWLKKQY